MTIIEDVREQVEKLMVGEPVKTRFHAPGLYEIRTKGTFFVEAIVDLITAAKAEGYEQGRIKGYTDSTRDHLGTEADWFNKGMKQGYQDGVKAMEVATIKKVLTYEKDHYQLNQLEPGDVTSIADQLLNPQGEE